MAALIRSGATAPRRSQTSSRRCWRISQKSMAQPVKAEDVMAYLAAVMAHPAFTARFKADLVRPGLRVPLTADAKLFAEAVALGSRSDLAALLWRALRRSRRRSTETGAAPAEGKRAVHSGRRRDPVGARAVARRHGLRSGNAAAEDRQGLCRERHAGNVGL